MFCVITVHSVLWTLHWLCIHQGDNTGGSIALLDPGIDRNSWESEAVWHHPWWHKPWKVAAQNTASFRLPLSRYTSVIPLFKLHLSLMDYPWDSTISLIVKGNLTDISERLHLWWWSSVHVCTSGHYKLGKKVSLTAVFVILFQTQWLACNGFIVGDTANST
jgi:hypothetical protein